MTEPEKQQFRQDVIAKMREQIGVKFTHQGRTPEQGFDCVGLPTWALLQCGYVPEDATLFNRRRYRKWPEPVELRAVLESECVEVEVAELQSLDFCLAALTPPYAEDESRHLMTVSYANHSWIYPSVIHTLAKRGGVVEHGFTLEWREMCSSYWRLKCLA